MGPCLDLCRGFNRLPPTTTVSIKDKTVASHCKGTHRSLPSIESFTRLTEIELTCFIQSNIVFKLEIIEPSSICASGFNHVGAMNVRFPFGSYFLEAPGMLPSVPRIFAFSYTISIDVFPGITNHAY